MLVKLITLSPFTLPFSKKRGMYKVGDPIQFDIKDEEEKASLLRILEDVSLKRYVQLVTSLPDSLISSNVVGSKSKRKPDLSIGNQSTEERTQEKVNKTLAPPTLVEDVKSKELEVKIKENKVDESVYKAKKDRFTELDELHWTRIRKIAEEEHGLVYDKFDKDVVINDILKQEFPNT